MKNQISEAAIKCCLKKKKLDKVFEKRGYYSLFLVTADSRQTLPCNNISYFPDSRIPDFSADENMLLKYQLMIRFDNIVISEYQKKWNPSHQF